MTTFEKNLRRYGDDWHDRMYLEPVAKIKTAAVVDGKCTIPLDGNSRQYAVSLSSGDEVCIPSVAGICPADSSYTFELFIQPPASALEDVVFVCDATGSSPVMLGDSPEFGAGVSTIMTFRTYDRGTTWLASVSAEYGSED